MRYLIFTSMLTSAFVLSGCASFRKASLLGAGIGAAGGASLGALSDGSAGNIIIGGALGGLMGAGAGYIANDLSEKSNKEAFEKGREADRKGSSSYVGRPGQPTLIPPRIETQFVDDLVRGNVFVPAHVEYMITQPAHWSR